LKSLRLLNCTNFSYIGLFVLGMKRNTGLQELELTDCLPVQLIFKIPIEVIGSVFPHLKCFRLNSQWFDIVLDELPDNYRADGIAESMSELRDLQLFANRLDNNALYDILDKCTHLESLDLRYCFNIKVSAELKAKCSKLKDVKSPNDSIKDYEYETFIDSPIRLLRV
jgi:hypothetical protein